MKFQRVCRRLRTLHREGHGFVAIEFVGAIAVLLLPVVMLVAVLPRWSEREHAGTVIARELARSAARTWPNLDAAASGIVDEVAANLNVAPTDVRWSVVADAHRGGQILATVTIVMPTLAVPGIGTAGTWKWTTTASVRIDDYRSR